MIVKMAHPDGSTFCLETSLVIWDADQPTVAFFETDDGPEKIKPGTKIFCYSGDLVIFSVDLATGKPAL